MVPDDRGRILLIHRTDNKYWSIPGGGMEPGESVREAAVREIKEETGMDCEITSLVGIYSNPRHVAAYDDGEVRQEFSICLVGRLLGGSMQTSSESSEVRFVPASDVPAYEIHPSIRMRIGHYLEAYSKASDRVACCPPVTIARSPQLRPGILVISKTLRVGPRISERLLP